MKLDNVAASIPDDRDYIYQPSSGPFPEAISICPDMHAVPVEDQLQLNFCTENSTASAVMFLLGWQQLLSRMFLAYNTRYQIESTTGNVGAMLRDAVRAAYHWGLPLESTWNYDPALIDTKPSDAAYAEGLMRLVTRYERIDVSTPDKMHQGFMSALCEGLPVIIATHVGQQIQHLTGPWQTHKMLPAALGYSANNGNTWIGNHATLLTGYDLRIKTPCPSMIEDGSYEDLNSWGGQYGDGGWLGYPRAALESDIIEAWVIKGVGAKIAPSYVTPPGVVLKWYWDNFRRDVTDPMDKDVQGWAMHPGGEIAFLECYQSIIDAGVQARLKVLRGQ